MSLPHQTIDIDPLDISHIENSTKHLSSITKKMLMEDYFACYVKQGRQAANLMLTRLDKGASRKKQFAKPQEKYAYEAQEAVRILGISGGVRLFKDNGLSAPKNVDGKVCEKRMVDPDVWGRKLKTKHFRVNELGFHHAGLVGRGMKQGAFTSHWWLARFIEQQKDSAAFMSRKMAISSDGDEMTLKDISQATVSNPVNRRNEMNVRMRGFEERAKLIDDIEEGEKAAESAGFICDFYTLTTPSKYHRKKVIGAKWTEDEQGKKRKKGGWAIDNPHYQKQLETKNKEGVIEKIENSPRAAQNYLVKVFSRIRAKLKRLGIETFGYRVVEPHHDGTPHWHLAYFMQPNDRETVRAVFRHYALQEDGEEAGALKRRFVAVGHDAKKGSVTGYMTKYISKNIAGFGIGEDFESGLDCDDAVLRVLAWKSLWGIRQFSFYGSPSVTVWRELRKLREPLANPTAEKARLAADGGHWDMYISIMRDHKISLVKTEVMDDNGEPKKNKYDEVITRISGIEIENVSGVEVIRTRFKEWFLIDVGELEARIIQGLPVADRENSIYIKDVQNLIESAKEKKKISLLHQATGGVLPRAFDLPWSSVNKCTEKIEPPLTENSNQEVLLERN